MKIHEKYMKRCIALAKNGLGTTYPNPLVGSVIVHNDTIIGEGWHQQAGQPHAEVHAIQSVQEKHLLKEATLYVNLEPCSHFGKTPPCSNLIIEMGIKKVVIGCSDPNPKVAGKGIQRLKDAGCEVMENVLQKECEALNKRFITFHHKKRPYVILKWAETQDGFIAPKQKREQKPVWITNEFSRQWAHKMRAEEQAILVGTTTVLEDNPSLTTRDWKGPSPIRVLLDKNLKIPSQASVYDGSVKTMIFSEIEKKSTHLLVFETIHFSTAVAQQICDTLFQYEIQSLMVEGGAKTLQTFIDENLWDEAFVFKGPSIFTEGTKAPVMAGTWITETKIKDDSLFHFINNKL
ncbi:MAG: bifunctional diaminohydroxyphosphoribosylaminopyrimidine deaminase/5-amino-6-(5-phosphoribosylamino)uracil reductase RibD [Flavobacteriaceae bacterium]|nr:bifunctional diaminohydroxyphosphoribosylaminopyrimidine deaminase/5-amino-6-(5-phosphoribosylamino)uracil reductase RibD [Flavobacteriaceae bacterium]